jgi:hypothetical protein
MLFSIPPLMALIPAMLPLGIQVAIIRFPAMLPMIVNGPIQLRLGIFHRMLASPTVFAMRNRYCNKPRALTLARF